WRTTPPVQRRRRRTQPLLIFEPSETRREPGLGFPRCHFGAFDPSLPVRFYDFAPGNCGIFLTARKAGASLSWQRAARNNLIILAGWFLRAKLLSINILHKSRIGRGSYFFAQGLEQTGLY